MTCTLRLCWKSLLFCHRSVPLKMFFHSFPPGSFLWLMMVFLSLLGLPVCVLCRWFISSWVLLLQRVGCGLCLCWVLPQICSAILCPLSHFEMMALPKQAVLLPSYGPHCSSLPSGAIPSQVLCCELSLPLLWVQSCFPRNQQLGLLVLMQEKNKNISGDSGWWLRGAAWV